MDPQLSKKQLVIRDALLGVYYYSGMGWIYNALWGRKRAIISFHNVLDGTLMRERYLFDNGVSAQIFEKQIQYLIKHWTVQPIEKINDADIEGLFLTFDDGLRNHYTMVRPILEKYGITALFAVCPGLVSGEIPHIWQHHMYLILRRKVGDAILLPLDGYQQPVAVTRTNIDHLEETFLSWVVRNRVANVYDVVREICLRNKMRYMRDDYLPDMFQPLTWDMIAEMHAQGHVIASHSWSHRILSLIPANEKKWELEKSKEVLEKYLGDYVENIVYPYGTKNTVDQESLVLARQVGYRRGFMNIPYTLFGPKALKLRRFSLPPRLFRPHLHATISGIKHHILERSG